MDCVLTAAMRTARPLLSVAMALAVGLIVSLPTPAIGGHEAGAKAYERGDYTTAFRLLLPVAEQGDAYAQAVLGSMYYNGHGVPQNDEEAVRWFRRAAEQGFADAQTGLGSMYYHGRGVPQNDQEAVR